MMKKFKLESGLKVRVYKRDDNVMVELEVPSYVTILTTYDELKEVVNQIENGGI